MKIQLNEIKMNRTRRYLTPVLRSYGQEFETMIHSVFKLAFGVGDIVVVKSGIKLEKHIFILVDTNIDTDSFDAFQKWVRLQPMYAEDYAYDNVIDGHLHMFVIKFPEEYLHIYQTFQTSEYSKMFTVEEMNLFFKNEETRQILVKDHKYLVTFTKKLNEEFGSTVTFKPEDLEQITELDLPINMEEETFNPKL